VGIYFFLSRDEAPKLEFMYLSSKINIVATLGVQKLYFKVISSALYECSASLLIQDHTHFLVKHEMITLQ